MALIRNELAKYPELADFAKDLRNKGESFRVIAEALGKKGLNISHMAVKNYFDNFDALGASIIRRDQLLRDEIKKDILNTTEQFKKANEVLWEIIEELRSDSKKGHKETSVLIKAIDSVNKQLDISSRIIGRIAGLNQTNINISHLDFSIKIAQILPKLESKGYIKILKPMEMEVIND